MAVVLRLPQLDTHEENVRSSPLFSRALRSNRWLTAGPGWRLVTLPGLSVLVMRVLRQKHSINIHSPLLYLPASHRLSRVLGHNKSWLVHTGVSIDLYL